MTSIIKVDQIQNAAGGVPTAADLGLNVSGSVLQVQNTSTAVSGATSSTTPVDLLTISFTPVASNSKLLILATHRWQENTNLTNAGVKLLHDTTTVFEVNAYNTYIGAGNTIDTNSYQGFVSSTGSTSARDIKFQHWVYASGGILTPNVNVLVGSVCSMTVIEIAG